MGLGSGWRLRPLAFGAWTDLAEIFPGIDPEVVVVVPLEPDRILSYAFCRDRLRRRLEHGQRSWGRFGWLAWFPMGLLPLFVAHGARASIAEEHKCVVRSVTVEPLNVHAGAGSQIYLYGLGVCSGRWRLKRRLHSFSIAQGRASRAGRR